MNVPYIPERLFRHGISPARACTERFYSPSFGKGLHLAGFDVETIGTTLFKHNDLYSVQIVMDCLENSHIFFPKKQGVCNLDFFFSLIGGYDKRIYATAHNASFDLGALLGNDVFKLMKGESVGGWDGKLVDGTHCFAILWNKEEKKRLTVADSIAWYKASLEKIALRYFKMQKLERPSFLGQRQPVSKEELDCFLGYAERDAKLQFLLTKRIYGLNKEGNVKLSLTPAQLSGRVFQKYYLSNRLFLPRLRQLPFIARTYHGAQFTAFGRGLFKKMYYYDINSLYPFAAIKAPLNFSNSSYEKISLNDIENGFAGFAGVRFRFRDGEKYPCLPQRRKINGFSKLVFPLQGLSYCTSEELLLALKKSCEISCFKGIGWYPAEKDISHDLGRYMMDIYSKKEELDSRKDTLTDEERNKRDYYKLLLNSLIGKFCQRNRNWLNGAETAGSLFKPDFGSLILSKGRAIINSLTSQYRAIYTDTDSLLTKKQLPCGTKIGQLKDVLGNGKSGSLLSIRSKLYFITSEGSLIKCAKHGFRLPSESVFKTLLQRRKKTFVPYSLTRLVKLKEAYRRHRLPRREINQTFKIMLKDDGKREYFSRLSTVEELTSFNTLSQPLQNFAVF